jgi:microcystin-dependent protein
MAEPFIGEIRLFAGDFAPRGWALCNGQRLPIAQNQALFALLGTTYGGDGRVDFALPDLQGRTPMHADAAHVLGETLGAESVTLIQNQMPMHTHALNATRAVALERTPTGRLLADAAVDVAVSGGAAPVAGPALMPAGHGMPHDNRPPQLVLTFIIALQGIFPARD